MTQRVCANTNWCNESNLLKLLQIQMIITLYNTTLNDFNQFYTNRNSNRQKVLTNLTKDDTTKAEKEQSSIARYCQLQYSLLIYCKLVAQSFVKHDRLISITAQIEAVREQILIIKHG